MLVMALRQAELSVNVTSNGLSTVALPAAVKAGGVDPPEEDTVPVTTISSNLKTPAPEEDLLPFSHP